jgi:tRNA modification GTPase
VLYVVMPGPRSYTGEDVVEIHCHGAPLVVERLLGAASEAGARAAEPGEFTRRAVLNGRMDLLQAEAVADLIQARVQTGARLAWEQLQGALSESLRSIRASLLGTLADVEANVDFSDEDLPEENVQIRLRRLDEAAGAIDRLLTGFAVARRHREGHRLVLMGRPNVGKSSLANQLLGHGRMIVSEEPGTTRDSVEETVDLGGTAFVLTDTAGLRDTPSAAESAAVARARAAADAADIPVVVIDGSVPLTSDDRLLLAWAGDREALVVINKRDLPEMLTAVDRQEIATASSCCSAVSALTGAGCGELVRRLVVRARGERTVEAQPVAITRVRHRGALEKASARLMRCRELAAAEGPAELVSIELRACLDELASITDPVDNEDVLDSIFSEFCIGK